MADVQDQDGFESPFPESERVLFRNNAIETALTQLTFPPILKIGKEVPVQFQEAVRHDYPFFRVREATVLPPELQAFQAMLPKEVQVKLYDFASADQAWTLTLSQDFLALQTTKYTRWEEFRDRIETAFQLLVEIYQPSFVSRIGLRYQDLFDRRELGLENRPWKELFKPTISGELTDDAVSSSVEEKLSHLVLRLNDTDGFVTINHGINFDLDEQRYFIDADFFCGNQTPVGDTLAMLERLKRHAGRFFRWCLDEPLRDAMGPEPMEGNA